MSDVASLEERRWIANPAVDRHSIATALRVALAQVERGEIVADHVIMCFGKVNKDTEIIESDWRQAGSLNGLAQIGLLEHIKNGMFHAN